MQTRCTPSRSRPPYPWAVTNTHITASPPPAPTPCRLGADLPAAGRPAPGQLPTHTLPLPPPCPHPTPCRRGADLSSAGRPAPGPLPEGQPARQAAAPAGGHAGAAFGSVNFWFAAKLAGSTNFCFWCQFVCLCVGAYNLALSDQTSALPCLVSMSRPVEGRAWLLRPSLTWPMASAPPACFTSKTDPCRGSVCPPASMPSCLQLYHAIGRVEAFGRPLGAGEAARLRGWLAAQPRPLPSPGVVPQHVAVQLAQQQWQQQERRHQRHHEPGAQHHARHVNHHPQPPEQPGTAAGGAADHPGWAAAHADGGPHRMEAGSERWQPGQPGLEEFDSLSPSGSSASSLSFQG